ncbi:autoinducer binding domain-containing protein [Chromobacterium sp. IIBBL 290-4]|uniref:LuxR family transcriptional regulator n=1 Tax=Chromobacterium sp. IIBBL 290-4 TaxID=2953890 RepID=UPI0020B6B201|nr:autoinducer binding domain-containing protein [Chromobacterium sp. IIBBL 290-4]UTH76503.1 LuxR family transcriptional regulator [Chromobacterium sp. IIBBL 290-4]
MAINKTINARPLPTGLTSSQQWTLLEWIHLVGHIETEQELKAFLEQVLAPATAERLLLALGRLNSQNQLQRLERIINVSYPAEWLDQYINENYAQHDPVLRLHLGQGPVIWEDRFSRAKGENEKRFIAEATHHGMANGVTFSAASERNRLGSILCLAGRESGRNATLISMLNSLTPHLHQAAVRVANLPPASPGNMPLSQREYDIFHWMSRGKTNWEIATILDISERTVKFHVANVIRKLNANNRTHAIVLGMHLALSPALVINE